MAGAWTLTAGTSAASVGVMIAAALVPPIGRVGIGIAWGFPEVATAAGVLVLVNVFVLVNVLAINVAGLSVLWHECSRPEHLLQQDEARLATRKRVVVLAVATVALSAPCPTTPTEPGRTSRR